MKSVLFWFFLNIILLFFTLVTGPEGTIKHILRVERGRGRKKLRGFFAEVTWHEPHSEQPTVVRRAKL